MSHGKQESKNFYGSKTNVLRKLDEIHENHQERGYIILMLSEERAEIQLKSKNKSLKRILDLVKDAITKELTKTLARNKLSKTKKMRLSSDISTEKEESEAENHAETIGDLQGSSTTNKNDISENTTNNPREILDLFAVPKKKLKTSNHAEVTREHDLERTKEVLRLASLVSDIPTSEQKRSVQQTRKQSRVESTTNRRKRKYLLSQSGELISPRPNSPSNGKLNSRFDEVGDDESDDSKSVASISSMSSDCLSYASSTSSLGSLNTEMELSLSLSSDPADESEHRQEHEEINYSEETDNDDNELNMEDFAQDHIMRRFGEFYYENVLANCSSNKPSKVKLPFT